ncbi:trehalose synthase [Rhizobium tropici CIAT 899]|uniref:maltose alpha-D-glucosyltransferase n=1 Tax=Rhizobium tropici TaxID=398 RepID=A0A6P1CDS7_RHITR|nr:trehalose synthase [Rhizobium tropici CIAT 899]MBB4245087.1 maltose alpha-D-glucosyltransferase/alpha-amylase [Rhizobium tropici]TGE89871.1 maltose alpha-D-glucosyltransferase [Rhizobium sp. SEMIA 4088]MBB5596450.1 maltose alpha-D-glucosyltransferase/alpha-amylase [Rhizobium tropici]MBB6495459.1 maltose alpha-D-glucosyltransferase/alpha-amylase [Rhizobium tropici]
MSTIDRNLRYPSWHKDAVIYQLHVKSFFDADGDGFGDFAGLTQKLDYLASLGVNTIWLLPFYPSPRRDDGYDVLDYRGINPQFGTIKDFTSFVKAAHARGMRVITELVINHTSDQHPWFQRARYAPPGSPERDFYVWSETDDKFAETRIIFVDSERSNWTWDPVARAYFWHRFYSHQPDLNYRNPEVVEALLDIMRFWLKAGVDGFRLDAVPYLVERENTNNENLPETHALLKLIRNMLDAERPGVILLAEANQWPDEAREYFGTGDECHMAFHFPLMPRIFTAIAMGNAQPIITMVNQTQDIPSDCQWAIFLRNHDELTLEMVSEAERNFLWNTYASDERARLNLGIRRRLSPLMDQDRRRVELLHMLLLSLPGSPVLYYGDEIGMGDNLDLGDRDGVRTPMQWSNGRNGGFSDAASDKLALPVIDDAQFGYRAINVAAQENDPHSLLNWIRRVLAIRAQHPAFARGSIRFLSTDNTAVIAYAREYRNDCVLFAANLANNGQAVRLDLGPFLGKTPVELFGETKFPVVEQASYSLTFQAYGYFLLSFESEAECFDD